MWASNISIQVKNVDLWKFFSKVGRKHLFCCWGESETLCRMLIHTFSCMFNVLTMWYARSRWALRAKSSQPLWVARLSEWSQVNLLNLQFIQWKCFHYTPNEQTFREKGSCNALNECYEHTRKLKSELEMKNCFSSEETCLLWRWFVTHHRHHQRHSSTEWLLWVIRLEAEASGGSFFVRKVKHETLF